MTNQSKVRGRSMALLFTCAAATTACPPLLWNIDCGPPRPDEQELCDLVAAETTCTDTGGGCVDVRCFTGQVDLDYCASSLYEDQYTTTVARPEDVDAVIAEQDDIGRSYYCEAHECSEDPMIVIGCKNYDEDFGRTQGPPPTPSRQPL